MLPGLPKPEVTNRIIMTPEHAKRLFLALQDNISKYEAQNGQITLSEGPKATFPMGGFGPIWKKKSAGSEPSPSMLTEL